MKVAYNWLKEFVAVTAPPEEIASRLALSGTNIAGIENGAHGAVIDTEVTSNRPDCLGMLGVAREVGAIYRLPVKFTLPKPAESASGGASDAVSVKIEAPELCGRFTARVIRGVKIQPSPAWLKDRLEAAGVASINNVVDVTNLVMLELGHPLHAFDYDLVRSHSIVVRRAKNGEKIRTLDGIERTLHCGIGCEAFRHCGCTAVGMRCGMMVRKKGRIPYCQARGLDLHCHVGEHELNGLEIGNRLAELLPLSGELARRIERGLRYPNPRCANGHAGAVKGEHRNLETIAFAANALRRRDAYLVKHHFGSIRRAMP